MTLWKYAEVTVILKKKYEYLKYHNRDGFPKKCHVLFELILKHIFWLFFELREEGLSEKRGNVLHPPKCA
jgi:hypothetical protein